MAHSGDLLYRRHGGGNNFCFYTATVCPQQLITQIFRGGMIVVVQELAQTWSAVGISETHKVVHSGIACTCIAGMVAVITFAFTPTVLSFNFIKGAGGLRQAANTDIGRYM